MIDFAPQSIAAEVLQNVRTILATRRGSVPLDRAFGISWEHLDAPLPEAKMRMMSDVIDAVRTYEPRAVIENVEVLADTEAAIGGSLHVRVTFSLAEGTEGAAITAGQSYTAEADSAQVITADRADRADRTAAQIAALQEGLAGLGGRLREIEVTDYPEIFSTGQET